MLRFFIEFLAAYLLFRFVVGLFRENKTPPSPPPGPKPDNSVHTEPRRKAKDGDYIDYEEVK